CAVLLAVLGDRSALPTLYVALEDWEPSVRLRVIEALAKLPDERSLAPLVAAFKRSDEDGTNRAAILTTLGALGHPKAVAVLQREFEKSTDRELRRHAFRALWRSRALLRRSTLVDLVGQALESRDSTLVYDAVLRAAELRSNRHTKALLALVDHP